MAEHTERLEVRLYGVTAGHLHLLERNGFYFQYDPGYIERDDAPPLSTKGPLGKDPWSERFTLRWFNGLLPESDRRERLVEALGIVGADTLSLLRAAGSECAGAVQIVEPGDSKTPRLHALTETAVSELLESLRTSNRPIEPTHRAAKLSLAGAQNKLVLHRSADGHWNLPVNGHPSTHILKPDNERYPTLIDNENWCMTVAARVGFDTARTWVETIDEKQVLVVERYDRIATPDGAIRRLHQEDLAQALGSRAKYQEEGGISARALSHIPGVDPHEFFDRLILSWAIGNCDAHAKNYSILEPGTPRVRLAPVYDLLSTEAHPELDQTLALAIGNARRLDTVNPNAIEHAGRQLGLDPNEPTRRAAVLGKRLAAAIEEAREEDLPSGNIPIETILGRADRMRRAANNLYNKLDTGHTGTTRPNPKRKKERSSER